MDWQLHESIPGVVVPPMLKREQTLQKVNFLKRLAKHRHAPVFIFTAEELGEVRSALAEHDDLFVVDQPSHIFIKNKKDVLDKGVYSVLNDWARENPSALVLRTWEQEYQRAKNAVFSDFYSKSVHWPTLLWQTFEADDIPPAVELGRVIERLVSSRMAPLNVNLKDAVDVLESQEAHDKASYKGALMAVLEGERFIRQDGLPATSIAPGDVFKRRGAYWLNVRPECDCIVRGGDDDVDLYCLKGTKASAKQMQGIDRERGTFHETHQQAAVFGMYNGETIVFNFKNLHIAKWSECKDYRVGRLLPPFITRVQQRYAAYAQRPGLPRIPPSLIP